MYAFGTPTLAFSFGNLAMLGWLAAAAVPLLIHLWNRRKHREAPWAAVQFLLAAIRKNARRMQFEQWLLLAIRTLIILLVVLAVAEPYAEELGVSFTPYRPTHRVFVLDGSYSMAYRQTDETLFARARRMIADIVEASRPGDAFSLILIGEPSRAIVQSPARSPVDFLDELDALQQPHGGGDVTTALALAEDAIERANMSTAPLTQHEVILLTDLHRASWQPQRQSGAPSSISERLNGLAARAAVLVLDVGQENAANAAVTELALEQPFLTMRSPATFTATIRNFGQQARPQTVVEFEVDGQPVGSRRINLPADGTATVAFTHTIETPAAHTATVRITRDFLPIDDERHLAVEVKERVRVLLVAGKWASASYLVAALDPDPSEDGTIETNTVSEIALSETDLSEYDCVFLCNVAQFTAGERSILARYLRQGGGLVVFLGDQVIPDVYNAVLGPIPEEFGHPADAEPAKTSEEELTPILPSRIGDLVSGEPVQFEPLDYRHPIIKPFQGREDAGLLSTPVYTYYRLQLAVSRSDVDVALGFGNGDPAIVTAKSGRGTCVLVATAGSLASLDSSGQPWTHWPVWPSFLPVVREVLNFAATGSQDRWNALVGQPIAARVPFGSSSILEVTRPVGGTDTVRVEDGGDGPIWQYAGTDYSGVYRIDAPEGDREEQLFAVNVDTAESDLARIDPAALPSGIAVRSTWQDELGNRDVGALLGEQRLHRWLLTASLGLMLVETLLASWFGRGAR